jgi:hypothetical protein
MQISGSITAVKVVSGEPDSFDEASKAKLSLGKNALPSILLSSDNG